MREKPSSVASHMLPNQGSNPQPFGVRDDTPTSRATQPGLEVSVFSTAGLLGDFDKIVIRKYAEVLRVHSVRRHLRIILANTISAASLVLTPHENLMLKSGVWREHKAVSCSTCPLLSSTCVSFLTFSHEQSLVHWIFNYEINA